MSSVGVGMDVAKVRINPEIIQVLLKKNSKKFVCSEKSRIFAPNMTSHASRKNSAPGEVFDFKPNVILESQVMNKKRMCLF